MNHRKQILKYLYNLYNVKGPSYAKADSLPPYKKNKEAFIKAGNQLLNENLIIGKSYKKEYIKDIGMLYGQIDLSLNPDKIKEIRKELDAWYKDPKFIIGTLIALIALIIAIMAL